MSDTMTDGTPTLPAAGEPYRVGLLAFSDGRRRVHRSLRIPIQEHGRVLKRAIERDPLLTVCESDEIACTWFPAIMSMP